MLTIFIDNKPYHVNEGRNLLQACLSLGFDLPYFCWHPALHSVGACRQCAVKLFKDEKDTRGRIVMSCMTPVSEGMRLSVNDPEARAFRSSVLEWLMLNHPHDCPVCDEGGECHLQDMTVMTGHTHRRTRFRKRAHRNQDLGPFINHEMNRCIQCYRCVRFYRDSAGGRDFNVFAIHDHVYFGRAEDGALESEFSGNLVEVCPTGVFTDKTFKHHYTRKWDLRTAPSLCVHCGLGCNTIPGERYGTLRRIVNRYHHDVNGWFLCDRGRFGYEFVNSGRRIRRALMRIPPALGGEGRGKVVQPVPKDAALLHAAAMLSGSNGVIGIGSPRASLESNFALRALAGPDHFYSGLAEAEHRLSGAIVDILENGPVRSASLHEVETSDAVLVLGEDVTNTAPLLALAIRRSLRTGAEAAARAVKVPSWDDAAIRTAGQEAQSTLFVASAAGTKLDDAAWGTYCASPDDLARLGFAVAHELNRDAPAPAHLREAPRRLAREIAAVLAAAARPVVVAGTSLGSEALVHAAANIAGALHARGRDASLCYAVPECNTLGLALLKAKPLADAVHAVISGQADTVFILENDLFRRMGDKAMNDFLGRARRVVVIDHVINETSTEADLTLPAATFAEAEGTLVNNEGRAQRHERVFPPSLDVRESWKWIRDIMKAAGRTSFFWSSPAEVRKDLAADLPLFRPVVDLSPGAGFRVAGQKIPRQPHRSSGRTAMAAHVNVHEPKPPGDPDSPLSFSMEGYEGRPPASLICRYWAPGWNSVQALNKFQQEVGGPLIGGDPGKRLIEPAAASPVSCFHPIPKAFQARDGEWLVVPFHHIFGSEELSALAPALAERSPKGFVALCPEDAARLRVREGDLVDVALGGGTHRLEARIRRGLRAGLAGLYPADAALPDLAEATYCTIGKTP